MRILGKMNHSCKLIQGISGIRFICLPCLEVEVGLGGKVRRFEAGKF